MSEWHVRFLVIDVSFPPAVNVRGVVFSDDKKAPVPSAGQIYRLVPINEGEEE